MSVVHTHTRASSGTPPPSAPPPELSEFEKAMRLEARLEPDLQGLDTKMVFTSMAISLRRLAEDHRMGMAYQTKIMERIADDNNRLNSSGPVERIVYMILGLVIGRYLTIDYTNYRGERGTRVIEPIDLVLKSTMHHPTPQWIMIARDVKRDVLRGLACASIHSMRATIASDLEGVVDAPEQGR